MKQVADNELLMERLVPCGIELMPRLWSDPALLTRWWGPEGFSTTTHAMDFRVGGEWDYTMHGPDGHDYGNLIRYTRIGEEGIDYLHFGKGDDAHASFKAVITFEPVTGSMTRMGFKMVFGSAEEMKQICDEYGAAEGLYQTTDRLAKEAELVVMVEAECAKLEQAVGRMRTGLARIPIEKQSWSYSDSSRSAVHMVAHSGWSLGWIRSMLAGTPYPATTTAIGDQEMREFELGFTDAESALALLDEKSSAWMAYARSLTMDDLDRLVQLPFGFGEMRMRDALGAAAWHTNEHCAQIEFIQTMLGDRDWGF
ncbi:MAG: SRPBCC domain-containing protein [Fimbriimonadaceae bacterium]